MKMKVKEKSYCFMCGSGRIRTKTGELRFQQPANKPGSDVVLPEAVWLECQACGERFLPLSLNWGLGV